MADREEAVRRMPINRRSASRYREQERGDTLMSGKPESTMYLTAGRTELYALSGEIRKALKQ